MTAKDLMLIAIAGAGSVLLAGFAQALTLKQIIAANPNFQLEDDGVHSQHIDLDKDGRLDVGDTIRGILEFPQLRNLDTAGVVLLRPTAGNRHLSAIFEIQLVSIVTVGNGHTPDPSDDLFDMTFRAYAPFAVELGLEPGAMIAFYEDTVDDTVLGGAGCTNVAPGGNCEAGVIDGTTVLQLGQSLRELDAGWESWNAGRDLASFEGIYPSVAVESLRFQLDVLKSTIGSFIESLGAASVPPGGNGLIPWLGSGSTLGTAGLETPYQASDDFDLQSRLFTP